MNRLLIANRGEIAVRVIRACREVGIQTVAVCSGVDRNALHVRLADSYCVIGSATAAESYLSIPALIAAALSSGVDAIHPGYGFLSERAEFARACGDAGLSFVGPPANVIAALGDKIAARAAMQAAGVPVTPGYNGSDQRGESLLIEAQAIGCPLLIKAAAGGGGRGMRIVNELGHFPDLLDEARREAMSAFGDDRVLLERYINKARHVEFQIFGDQQGGLVHLFERDCSIQRRYQKIIEESPCTSLSPNTREQMAAAAVLAGRTVGYVNAGTVEFLLEDQPDGGQQFYFMEVNTRLQVEHPVTELVTGIDLVQLQLKVAAGASIPYSQPQISSKGHCIEARIYAEDPSRGFMPSTGTLHRWIVPQGPGIRVDSGVVEGDTITPYYDAMLAKLVVYADTRELAVCRLREALSNFCVLGIDTNIPYLQDIVDHPIYRQGEANTRFLTDNFSRWAPTALIPDPVMLALAADVIGSRHNAASTDGRRSLRRASPWQTDHSWRNS